MQRSATSSCKDVGITKFELVAENCTTPWSFYKSWTRHIKGSMNEYVAWGKSVENYF